MGDEVVGAIGTSGETPDEDEAVSIAGAATEFSAVETFALTYEGRAVPRRLSAQSAQRAASLRSARLSTQAATRCIYGGRKRRRWRASASRPTRPGPRRSTVGRARLRGSGIGGHPSALHLARAVPLQGGMPIVHNGEVIGAVGVGGASSADEDRGLAVLASHALAATNGVANGAAFFDEQDVRQKFATGGLLLDAGAYKLDAGRREAPSEAEYHAHTVDVMHVVQGTANVITGGEMVGTRTVADGEMRAESVTGGHAQELSAGDVLAVPAGVLHQFERVSDPFLYFVVKVEV